MRMTGLEPARLAAQEPKSCMSANSITSAAMKLLPLSFKATIIILSFSEFVVKHGLALPDPSEPPSYFP